MLKIRKIIRVPKIYKYLAKREVLNELKSKYPHIIWRDDFVGELQQAIKSLNLWHMSAEQTAEKFLEVERASAEKDKEIQELKNKINFMKSWRYM
jgi:hypothetical protein